MTVYICKSPEVDDEFVQEVLSVLNNGSQILKFKFLPLNYDFEAMPFLKYFGWNVTFDILSEQKKQHYMKELGPPLSWREFFMLSDFARKEYQLEKNALVICLTNRRNSLNYFSMIDEHGNRNAFIQCSDWELFMPGNAVYPVSYEVISNMLLLLGWHHIPNLSLQNFHEISIGCINDYCVNKTEIILKLRTGDICPDCLEHMLQNSITPAILRRSLKILEAIRLELKFSQGFLGSLEPKPIQVINGRKILIGDLKMNLSPLEKTILIFFLKHPEGVRLCDLVDHEEELFGIYQHVKGNAERSQISNLVSPLENNFSFNKSRLHRKLKNQLGPDLAQFYIITGKPGEAFGVQLEESKISFIQEVPVR